MTVWHWNGSRAWADGSVGPRFPLPAALGVGLVACVVFLLGEVALLAFPFLSTMAVGVSNLAVEWRRSPPSMTLGGDPWSD